MSAGSGVRQAELGDLGAIVEIERLSLPDPWGEAAWRAEVEHAGSLVLAAGEPLQGYAGFRQGPGEAELLRIAVHPRARRGGVATALLEQGLADLRAADAATCHLEVRADNGPALAFYRRHGFAEVGRRRRYYAGGADALLLSRTL